jgi:DNA end-binding protein Ku
LNGSSLGRAGIGWKWYITRMSLRPFASGMVSFGLVTIPVKLYSTGESAAGITLNMLHAKCGSRLRQQYFCPVDNEVVGRDEMVKGYEYAKGQYVLFTEEELKALNPEPTNAIEIAEFVPVENVDPIYFEKSYYLGPDKGGDRPYRLLAEAMKQTGRAALARYAARGKDHLVLLRPFEGGLIMQQLRYADELRSFSEVPLGPAEVKEPELRLAIQLIDQIAAEEFHPAEYEDHVRLRTRELIEQKIQGHEITAAPPEAPRAQIIDLMAALKASLESARPSGVSSVETAKVAKAEKAPKAAKTVALGERKPPRPSPRTADRQATAANDAEPAAPRKKTTKSQ